MGIGARYISHCRQNGATLGVRLMAGQIALAPIKLFNVAQSVRILHTTSLTRAITLHLTLLLTLQEWLTTSLLLAISQTVATIALAHSAFVVILLVRRRRHV